MIFSSVAVIRPYEQIVNQIQQAIRDGQLARGSKLPTERNLSETFGVSRSVVREAIKVLDAMGLVESRQGSGLYVRNESIQTVSRAFVLSVSPDAESVDRLFEFRQGLEAEAARLAAQRRTEAHLLAMKQALGLVDEATDPQDWDVFGEADTRFHILLAEASANPYLQVAVATARDMQRDVVNLFAEQAGSMQEAMTHHRMILDAIEQRDTERAASLMSRHIRYTSRVVQSHIVPPAGAGEPSPG